MTNRIMYQDYFGIGENPFSLTPDPRYLYMSEGHQEALAHLLYGVSESGGFVLLTGEVGTGKTTVCRCLLEQLPGDAEVALILNPRLNDVELLASICEELGVGFDNTNSHKVLIDRLNQHLLHLHAQGRRAVLIVDEAQNLSPGVLEQVRLLTNLETNQHKLLQVILIGQPELTDLLNRRELRQLAQRISSRHHLEALNAAESKIYITHRVGVGGLNPTTFPPAACAEVYKFSHGIPRLINSLCDRCLLAAYVQGTKQVNRNMVRTAAAEVFGSLPKSKSQVLRLFPWAATLVIMFGAVVAFLESPNLWMAAGVSGTTDIVETTELSTPLQDRDSKSSTDGSSTNKRRSSPIPQAQSTSGSIALLEAPANGTPPELATMQVGGERGMSSMEPEESISATRTAALAQSTASAPPEGVDATAVMTLDQLFSLNEVSDDGSVALAQLFGLWHHDYGALAGRDVCAKARLGGLRCLRGKSSVKALATLNRPAVLHFTSPGGIQFPAVLTALEGSWMTFTMGEHLVRASSKEVAAAWNGEYLLLWRPPAGYQRALRRGSKGAAVAWLRDRLAELANEPAPAAAEKTFDAALEAQVIAFQRNHLLLNDGIAGPRTLIQLQNTLGDQDVVLLAANP